MCAKKTNQKTEEAPDLNAKVKVKGSDRFHMRTLITYKGLLSKEQFRKLREGESVLVSREVLQENPKHLTEV